MKLVELTNHKLVGIENPDLNFDTLFVKIDVKLTELLALEDTKFLGLLKPDGLVFTY